MGQDYPGQKIGPEPTSDKFSILLNSNEDRVIPGQSLTMSPDLPYRGLEKFGSHFLENLEANKFKCDILDKFTIIDTPGVLSTQSQTDSRPYDFAGVVEWFAERSDLILLFFDPEKLDISDEMRRVISKLSGQESKLRIILNKLDKVDELELVRVYGSLMWSLGRALKSTDVVKVYMGSFGAPGSVTIPEHNAQLINRDKAILMNDFNLLARDGPVRKVNRLVKRVRLLKVLCVLLAHMKDQMPMLLWKKEKQQEMSDGLDDIYQTLMIRHDFPAGDFPNKERFRAHLAEVDLSEVKKLKKGMLESLDVILDVEAPRLFQLLPGGVSQNFDDPIAALHVLLMPGLRVLKYGKR
jgi:EH domain-containing protein 1